MAGGDVATVPPSMRKWVADRPLTDKGLDAVGSDWKNTGQSIF